MNNKFAELEENIRTSRDLYNSINKTWKEENLRIDCNIKALWDSFGLLTSSLQL